MNALRLWSAMSVVLAVTACAELPKDDDGNQGTTEARASVATAAQSLSVLWNVPYLNQRSYSGIGRSACGPTSVTMLLRYLFPGIKTDVPEVYGGGTQAYTYNGPLVGYRNISGETGDYTIDSVPAEYRPYYGATNDSGAIVEGLASYLKNVWDLSAVYVGSTDADAFYAALRTAPTLVRTYGHGNVEWGHWVIAIGIEENGTPDRSDDVIVVHDPYGNWGSWDGSDGRSRHISHHEFFVAAHYGQPWYRGMLRIDGSGRKMTYVSDNATPNYAGSWYYSALNSGAWMEKYRDASSLLGDYVFVGSPTQVISSSQWFIWPSVVPASGWYDIVASTVGSSSSGTVTYSVQSCDSVGCAWKNAYRVVDQRRSTTQRIEVKIARAYLAVSDVVVANVTPNTAVDAVRFHPVAAPTCAYHCADYHFATAQCYQGWYCEDNGCLGWQGSDCTTCRYQCSSYGYEVGQCYSGWHCRSDGCLQYEGSC